MPHPSAPGRAGAARTYDPLMIVRLLRAAALLALTAGCAGPHHVVERPAGYAHPEPDPACHGIVAQSLQVNGLEQVTVRVALGDSAARIELLAPELTPAAAAEVRRAFAECAWRPGPDGAEAGVVTFTRR